VANVHVEEGGGGRPGVRGSSYSRDPCSVISPNHGGNTGSVTVIIYGLNVSEGATARLSRAGYADIQASSAIASTDGSFLTATLPLRGASIGAWDVVVDLGAGTLKTNLAAFTVEPGSPPSFAVQLVGRSEILSSRTYFYYAVIQNMSNVDFGGTLELIIPASVSVQSTDAQAVIRHGAGIDVLDLPAASIPAGTSQIVATITVAADLPSGATFSIPIIWKSVP